MVTVGSIMYKLLRFLEFLLWIAIFSFQTWKRWESFTKSERRRRTGMTFGAWGILAITALLFGSGGYSITGTIAVVAVVHYTLAAGIMWGNRAQ